MASIAGIGELAKATFGPDAVRTPAAPAAPRRSSVPPTIPDGRVS